jgi:hypothetical protein
MGRIAFFVAAMYAAIIIVVVIGVWELLRLVVRYLAAF